GGAGGGGGGGGGAGGGKGGGGGGSGRGAGPPPSPSPTPASSPAPMPRPPACSGTVSAGQPSSTMWAHSASGAAPFSTTSRTRAMGHSRASIARTPSRSSSCSVVNSRCTATALSQKPDGRVTESAGRNPSQPGAGRGDRPSPWR